MLLDLLGTSTEAALALPVPSRATVRLADARVWTDLQQLAAPVVRQESRPALSPGLWAHPPLR